MAALFRRVHFFYCRRRPNVNVILLALGTAGAVFLLLLFVLEHNLKPTIREIAEAQARWIATEAVNNAVKQKIADSVDYHELIAVQKDAEGRIVLMQPNIVRINQLASETTLAINDALKELSEEKFSIPVGQVLGSQLLANYGPHIRVSIYPVGTVNTTVTDHFEEAGINQTRHRLYLNIQSRVKVVVPLITSQVKVSAQVPVTDTIIVGQVPDAYVNFLPPKQQRAILTE
ncbi:sporulation protein YunB [Thermacetogenium phaeum DSM 12270]|uniref:Sporulation protein YunB n=1 Tax=Thermacetogenium phaeum (strain ATCC BAA-254 / DSM 26808 / PB) TaxID=1089553 RepID=K4LGM9_THEPS|nr:sporulation protein YunB [Thermacetogenium phaeum]AFV12023.1 sporulation protein YunB [Thermacetogenium phaeum DSM 12270]